jgi:hypothetical protein
MGVVCQNRVSLYSLVCTELAILIDVPQTCHLTAFTEDVNKTTPIIMTGLNPFCISFVEQMNHFAHLCEPQIMLHRNPGPPAISAVCISSNAEPPESVLGLVHITCR